MGQDTPFENQRATIREFKEHRVSYRLNNSYMGIMHHKFFIIDDKIVATGSFNWTDAAATRNQEDLIIVKNSKKLLAVYKERFRRLYRKTPSVVKSQRSRQLEAALLPQPLEDAAEISSLFSSSNTSPDSSDGDSEDRGRLWESQLDAEVTFDYSS